MQSGWIYRWFDKRTYDLVLAGREITRDIGQEAVLIGPYAQALTIDNELRSFIYWFGMARKDPNLFNKYPLTHLAVDNSNMGLALQAYPFLKNAEEVTSYVTRGIEFRIIRLDDSMLLRNNIRYSLSDFEKAVAAFHKGDTANAAIHINRFLNKYPRSRSGLMLLSNYFFNRGALDKGLEVCEKLIGYYPRDFILFLAGGYCVYNMYLQSKDEMYLRKADSLFDRGVDLNPAYKDEIKRMKREADSLYYTGE